MSWLPWRRKKRHVHTFVYRPRGSGGWGIVHCTECDYFDIY